MLGLVVAVFMSAGYQSEGSSAETDPPNLGADAPVYVLGSRIRDPSGRAFFVTVLNDPTPRQLDLSQSRETRGFARSYAHEGAVFLMDSESIVITRYEVTDDLQLVEDGRFSMARLGLASFDPQFYFVAPDRAVYVNAARPELVFWNPTEMVIEEVVPLEIDPREGFRVQVNNVQQVGNRLYMVYGWFSTNIALEPFESVGVVIVDATSGETIARMEDERCAAGTGGFVRDNGDVYVMGGALNAAELIFMYDVQPTCMLRIRNGAQEFDADYYVNLTELTGAGGFSGLAGLSNGTFVTRALSNVDPDDFDDIGLGDQLDLFQVWEWLLVDIEAEESTRLGTPLTGVTFPPFVLDDEQLAFPTENITAGTTGTSTLYFVEDGEARESVTVPGEILQLSRVR